MKCLILAAGYATRLYPLTENFPKPLLKVQDKTILDWLIDDIDGAGLVDEYVVISNHKFAHHFQTWADKKNATRSLPLSRGTEGGLVTVVDDGTSTNETRLGAVCDIQYAIDKLNILKGIGDYSEGGTRPFFCPTSEASKLERWESGERVRGNEGVFVIAGDNVLDFSLQRFVRYANEKQTSCVMRFHEPSEERLHKCGVLEIDDADRILGMEEKPAEPKSHWVCPPFYYYKAEDAARIPEAIKNGCGTDAPGSFIAWLCQQTTVHAMEMPGKRYDIGNLQSYEQVQKEYPGIGNK